MGNLIKIRDVSSKYDITARTLRYYEDMGLITSTRSEEYAYRLYDDTSIKKLEQILILRKLNISVRDIKRVFDASGSEIVIEVLGKKVEDIDGEVALLHELKGIVLSFIEHIKQSDFSKESDVKLLYDKAREIEANLANVDYDGNAANINRLLEVTEKLDKKIPDVMVVHVPKFRAFTTGLVGWDTIFGMGSDEKAIELTARGLTVPILFDGIDFLYGKDGKAAWIWRIKDEVTEADTHPFEITEFQGGLYAVSVSVDNDGESHDKVRNKTSKWLKTTNFIMDNDREMLGHMIYTHEYYPDIMKGLGYEQMLLYAPIKLKEDC